MKQQLSIGINTYPVGLFADYLIYKKDKKAKKKGVRSRLNKQIKANLRNKEYWVGYRAIWQFPPHGIEAPKPATAWSRRRARKKLGHNIVDEHISQHERMVYIDGWEYKELSDDSSLY